MKNNITQAIQNLLAAIENLGSVRDEVSARTILIQLGSIAEQVLGGSHPVNTEIRELHAKALVTMASSLFSSYDYENALILCQEGFNLMSPDNELYAYSAYFLGRLHDHQSNLIMASKFLKIAVYSFELDDKLYLDAVKCCTLVETDLAAIELDEKKIN